MTPNRSNSGGLAKLTPQQVLENAIRAYAEATSETYGPVVVTDWALVAYVEEFATDGTPAPRYVHTVSRRSSPHALRGLVNTLVEFLIRRNRT